MTSDADREKTKTAPELAPELKLLVRRRSHECALDVFFQTLNRLG